jgi:hypothetical protein
MYTLIGSAKLNEIDLELYLRTVLAQIADHPISQIQGRLPGAWPHHSSPTLPRLHKTHSTSVHQKTSGHLMTHFTGVNRDSEYACAQIENCQRAA